MSMIGNFLRIAPKQLEDLLREPQGILDFLYPEDGPDHEPSHHLDIDKSWHLIHFLLNGSAWDIGSSPAQRVILGGIEIGTEDVGYGPARYFTPAQVSELATALAAIDRDALWSRFDLSAVRKADLYPPGWSDGDRDYILNNFARISDFFRAAAKEQQVVIAYLN